MIPNQEQHEWHTRVDSDSTETTSSLPSRSSVHKKKKKRKSTSKMKVPIIKLLVFCFILLPIGFIWGYSYYYDRPAKEVGSDVKDSDEIKSTENVTIVDDSQDTQVHNSDQQIESASVKNEQGHKNSIHDKDSDKKGNGYTYVYHTVQAQETLLSISMHYYQSKAGIRLIQKENGLKGNYVSVGQKLKIPMKKK